MTVTHRAMWLSQKNPFRPPAWRWYLATAIVEGTPEAKRNPPPDTTTLAAIDALRDHLQQPDTATSSDSSVLRARAIWQSDGWDRCLLESRLLTGVSLPEVAQQLQLPLGVGASYRDLFFDVLSRLRHASYVQHAVIRAPARFDEPPHLQTAIRAFAYFGGHHVLDVLLAAHAAGIATSEVIDQAFNMELDPKLAKVARVAVSTWIAPITEENADIWICHYFDQLAAEKFGNRRQTWHDISEALRRGRRKRHPAPDNSAGVKATTDDFDNE